MDKPNPRVDSTKMPILERMDYGHRLPDLPDMPNYLRWITLAFRVAPAFVEALLGLVIATNPPGSSQPFLAWTTATYGMSAGMWAVFLALFGLFALLWTLTGRWRDMMLLRVAGLVIGTFPLLLFVGLLAWWTLIIDPVRSRITVLLALSVYALVLLGYAKTAGQAIWFEQIRLSLKRKGRG